MNAKRAAKIRGDRDSVRGRLRHLESAYRPKQQTGGGITTAELLQTLQGDAEGPRLLGEVSSFFFRVVEREPALRDVNATIAEAMKYMSDTELKAFRELIARLNARFEIMRERKRGKLFR